MFFFVSNGFVSAQFKCFDINTHQHWNTWEKIVTWRVASEIFIYYMDYDIAVDDTDVELIILWVFEYSSNLSRIILTYTQTKIRITFSWLETFQLDLK